MHLNNAGVEEILARLRQRYPEARSGLSYRNAFELLVAAVLSAQSTDRQVNRVTASLFKKYPTPATMASIEPEQLAGEIKSIGLYRAKSRQLVALSRMLVEKYGGKVPGRLEELLRLPGVGRKVALVVLSNAFGQDVIAVDTHVFRVANRLGLTKARNVRQAEDQLMQVLPSGSRGLVHHLLIQHGREVCKARNPKCQECFLSDLCVGYTRQGRE
ncbi:MAG: endonuclease [Clostridia bacterium]|nr:endonuclease [Clostridia bacterium]